MAFPTEPVVLEKYPNINPKWMWNGFFWETIPENSAGVMTVINQNGGLPIKVWLGTREQYDALVTKLNDVAYIINPL